MNGVKKFLKEGRRVEAVVYMGGLEAAGRDLLTEVLGSLVFSH